MFSFFITKAHAQVPDFDDLEVVFVNALNSLIAAAGIAALVMIIVGGFRYSTAAGDEKAMKDAQKTISYAVMGLVLAVAAYFIIKFIGEDILKVDLFNFDIKR